MIRHHSTKDRKDRKRLKSWDDYNIQERLKTILLQSFLFGRGGGQTRRIIGDFQMVIVQNKKHNSARKAVSRRLVFAKSHLHRCL